MYVRLDEETLKAIAGHDAREYFHAGTARPISRRCAESLNARLVLERKETEITFCFAASRQRCYLRRRSLSLPLVQPDGLSLTARAGDLRSGCRVLGIVDLRANVRFRTDRSRRGPTISLAGCRLHSLGQRTTRSACARGRRTMFSWILLGLGRLGARGFCS